MYFDISSTIYTIDYRQQNYIDALTYLGGLSGSLLGIATYIGTNYIEFKFFDQLAYSLFYVDINREVERKKKRIQRKKNKKQGISQCKDHTTNTLTNANDVSYLSFN